MDNQRGVQIDGCNLLPESDCRVANSNLLLCEEAVERMWTICCTTRKGPRRRDKTHAYTHASAHTQSHTHSHTHAVTHTVTHTHAHAHAHAHTLTHKHTNTHRDSLVKRTCRQCYYLQTSMWSHSAVLASVKRVEKYGRSCFSSRLHAQKAAMETIGQAEEGCTPRS